MRIVKFVLVLALLVMGGTAVSAGSDPLDKFYGAWANKSKGSEADVVLKIDKAKDGFKISWKDLGPEGRAPEMGWLTFASKDSGKSYQRVAASPDLETITEATAKVEGEKLTVTIVIEEGGTKVVGTYVRTVSGDNLTLDFDISANGENMAKSTEKLNRFKL